MKLSTAWLPLTMILLVGCATNDDDLGLYYWDRYSESLYSYTNEPSEQTRQSHIEHLQGIITTAEERELRVPPGIHFELATMYAEDEQNNLAFSHFEQERALFPESSTLVDLAMTQWGLT